MINIRETAVPAIQSPRLTCSVSSDFLSDRLTGLSQTTCEETSSILRRARIVLFHRDLNQMMRWLQSRIF